MKSTKYTRNSNGLRTNTLWMILKTSQTPYVKTRSFLDEPISSLSNQISCLYILIMVLGWLFDSILLAGVAISVHYFLVQFIDKKEPLPLFLQDFLDSIRSSVYYDDIMIDIKKYVLSFLPVRRVILRLDVSPTNTDDIKSENMM